MTVTIEILEGVYDSRQYAAFPRADFLVVDGPEERGGMQVQVAANLRICETATEE